MSVKSKNLPKILPVLVLAATMGISACVAHVREPYGYYGGGYRYGHANPRTTVVYRDHDRYRHDDRDRWRRDSRYRDNDRDNDGIHDRWDRRD